MSYVGHHFGYFEGPGKRLDGSLAFGFASQASDIPKLSKCTTSKNKRVPGYGAIV